MKVEPESTVPEWLFTRLELNELAEKEKKTIDELKRKMKARRKRVKTREMIESYNEEMGFIVGVISEMPDLNSEFPDLKYEEPKLINQKTLVKFAKKKQKKEKFNLNKMIEEDAEEKCVIMKNRCLKLSEMDDESREIAIKEEEKAMQQLEKEHWQLKIAAIEKKHEEEIKFANIMAKLDEIKKETPVDPVLVAQRNKIHSQIIKLESAMEKLQMEKDDVDMMVRVEKIQWLKIRLQESDQGKSMLKTWKMMSKFEDWKTDELTYLNRCYHSIKGPFNEDEFVLSVLHGEWDPEKYFSSKARNEWLSKRDQIKTKLKELYQIMESLPPKEIPKEEMIKETPKKKKEFTAKDQEILDKLRSAPMKMPAEIISSPFINKKRNATLPKELKIVEKEILDPGYLLLKRKYSKLCKEVEDFQIANQKIGILAMKMSTERSTGRLW